MRMEFTNDVLELLRGAEQKVLATVGVDGPNVIPLSMVEVETTRIYICDCFMDKTVQNIRQHPQVSLAFWKGFDGVQVKGIVAYLTEGDEFERFRTWLTERHPERTLRGVLSVEPTAVYDIAPARAGVQVA